MNYVVMIGPREDYSILCIHVCVANRVQQKHNIIHGVHRRYAYAHHFHCTTVFRLVHTATQAMPTIHYINMHTSSKSWTQNSTRQYKTCKQC